MTNDKTAIYPFTPVLIRLLKGPVEYLDKSVWDQLLQYQAELTRLLQNLGLILVLALLTWGGVVLCDRLRREP